MSTDQSKPVKKMPRAARMLLVAGLILVTITPLLSGHFRFPDYIKGTCMGLGVGLELMSLVIMRKKQVCR